MTHDSYLTVASILAGFGVTVLMFRIQRELHVRETRPGCPNWLAWADYLAFGAIILSLLFVVFPLTILGDGRRILAVAAGSCGAAAILMAAYPFAILDHYRIEIGKNREGNGKSGEPIEKAIVIAAYIAATAVLSGTISLGWWC